MTSIAEAELGYKQRAQKHNWMADEILALFEEQRKYKKQGNVD